MRTKACLLVLVGTVLAQASIRPSFWLGRSAWEASEVLELIATADPADFRVAAALKGETKPGTVKRFPELAPVAGEHRLLLDLISANGDPFLSPRLRECAADSHKRSHHCVPGARRQADGLDNADIRTLVAGWSCLRLRPDFKPRSQSSGSDAVREGEGRTWGTFSGIRDGGRSSFQHRSAAAVEGSVRSSSRA